MLKLINLTMKKLNSWEDVSFKSAPLLLFPQKNINNSPNNNYLTSSHMLTLTLPTSPPRGVNDPSQQQQVAAAVEIHQKQGLNRVFREVMRVRESGKEGEGRGSWEGIEREEEEVVVYPLILAIWRSHRRPIPHHPPWGSLLYLAEPSERRYRERMRFSFER